MNKEGECEHYHLPARDQNVHIFNVFPLLLVGLGSPAAPVDVIVLIVRLEAEGALTTLSVTQTSRIPSVCRVFRRFLC